MSERLLTEAELMDIQGGSTVLTGNTIDLLIADHRRMRELLLEVQPLLSIHNADKIEELINGK